MTPQSSLATSRPTPRVAVTPSAIRRATGDLGADSNVISLALGQPSWPLPEAARQALAAVDAAPYGQHQGDTALRRSIVTLDGAGRPWLNANNALVTCGAQAALYSLVQAFLGPADAALVPDPGFPAYAELTRMTGAEPVPYALAPQDGFRLDARAIEDGLKRVPKARLVFICHPSNPTGAGADRDTLYWVAELCAEHGALLVSDEVYRHLHAPHADTPPSLLEVVDEGLHGSCAVVSSVSKAWGAPGLRIGWLMAGSSVVEACQSIHSWAVTAAAGPSQTAALALLEASDIVLPAARCELDRRWQTLHDAWCAGPWIEQPPSRPDGGIYAWIRLPKEAHDDPTAFCRRLRRRAHVAIVPGLAFGEQVRGWARLSFAGPINQLEIGIERLLGPTGLHTERQP